MVQGRFKFMPPFKETTHAYYLLHDKYSISVGANQAVVLRGGFGGVLDDVGEKFVERFPYVGKMFGDFDAHVVVSEVLCGVFLFAHFITFLCDIYPLKTHRMFYRAGSFRSL